MVKPSMKKSNQNLHLSSIFPSYVMPNQSSFIEEKYLLSIYYSADMMLRCGVGSVNKIGIVSAIEDLTFK